MTSDRDCAQILAALMKALAISDGSASKVLRIGPTLAFSCTAKARVSCNGVFGGLACQVYLPARPLGALALGILTVVKRSTASSLAGQ